MRLLVAALAVVLSLSWTAAPVNASGYDLAAIDAFLQSEMRELSIPGLSVAVVDGDRIVHAQGFGVADGSGRRVTPQTPFRLASTSKAFTALAVIQLVEAGRLQLDRTVRSYLPWFTTTDPGASGQITLRQLLNQTSGLSTSTGNADNLQDDVAAGALERGVRRLAAQSLVSAPGAEFHYSNSNYEVLGLLVEVASGETFGAYLDEHVLRPLDMRHTHTSLAAAQADGLAQGYYRWFGVATIRTDFPFTTASVPAAGIFSSAEDLAHALIAHLNSGRYGGRSVLSAAGMEQLHTGTSAAPGYGEKYAMGWFVHPLFADPELSETTSDYHLPLVVDHNGTWATYHSVMILLPGFRLGGVLLVNRYDATNQGRFARLQYGLERLLVGQAPPPADAIPDNPLAQNGRLLLSIALALQLALLGAWLARRRRPAGSRRASLLRRGAALVGVLLDLAGLAFLWLLLPGMFDEVWNNLPREVPDIGLLMGAFTLTAAIWLIVSGVSGARLIWPRRPSPRQ
jgi:CubicO group peptidase (beta-lactamase class C family)